MRSSIPMNVASLLLQVRNAETQCQSIYHKILMCKPKVKIMTNFLKFFLGKNIIGITLCPFGIYVQEKYLTRQRTINHEKIHWQQQLEMLIIFFYLWYFIEWFIRIFVNGRKAYISLSFEREAYAMDDDLTYLERRKPYAWLKYMKIAA